jgi:putative FmdB family regulatory protein
MPIFEFKCLECKNVFEKLFMGSEEFPDLSCPQCHSYSLERVVSRTNYAMAPGPNGKKAKYTTKSCGPSNQCMTLDLPGHTRD